MSFEPLGYPYVAPTLVRTEYFYPRQDAETLRRAMKGLGTDEKAIITVLTERTNQQRQEIAEEFSKTYDKDLIKNFKSELSGDFRDLVVAAMTPKYELLARDLQAALTSSPPVVDTIIEIVCNLCNSWLHDLAAIYLKIFEISLDRAIRGCSLPGVLPKILASIARGVRNEEHKVDGDASIADAEALIAESGRLSADDSRLSIVLSTRSHQQLRRMFVEHETRTGEPFDETIRREFPKTEESGMLSVVFALRNSSAYLASRFYASMIGLGTNERLLNRLVLIRCELDLEDIKQDFVVQYKKSLASFIEGDTSGLYKRMLLALVK